MTQPTVKLIAFYLPQFHPIRENDLWWGKGFTDWINVVRAQPIFVGHYQPHLPADLGFYDLRLEDTRIAQAELALEYGIYGFCYYYYWFNGKRLLERPFQEVLTSGRPNFPFCLCWANENWTRRWDGREDEVLMAQQTSLQGAKAFITHLFRAFDDPRYIRVYDRPLLLVYRVDIIPDLKQIVSLWRKECRNAGVGEPYLCLMESFSNMGIDPRTVGFDAAVEFPPHNQGWRYMEGLQMLSKRFSGTIFDWEAAKQSLLDRQLPRYTLFRTVMPMWDNTPRKQDTAHIYYGSSPEAYAEWLQEMVLQTKALRSQDERLVFVNAWNEWGEGNHLEPDLAHGHAYLRATQTALTQGAESP